jgi:thioredoxin 1
LECISFEALLKLGYDLGLLAIHLKLPIWRPHSMSENIVHVTDASFETDVLQSDTPALVDFWAEWCGPCKMIAPILSEIADEYAGKMKICKVDVDSNPETAAKFNVRGIPTLLVFKNGAVEATKVGALSKTQLVEFVDGLV